MVRSFRISSRHALTIKKLIGDNILDHRSVGNMAAPKREFTYARRVRRISDSLELLRVAGIVAEELLALSAYVTENKTPPAQKPLGWLGRPLSTRSAVVG